MAVWTGASGNVSVGYADSPVSFSDEAMTINQARTLAYIADADKRAWDPDTAVTLTYSDTYAGKATIYRAGGYVRFDPALDAGITLTASGKYIPVAEVCLCKSFSFDASWNSEDATTIPCSTSTHTGWQVNKPTTRTISGSMELLVDDTLSHAWRDAIVGNPDDNPAVVGNEILFVEFGITGSWGLYALVWPSTSIAANASALNNETISFVLGEDPPCFI